jgi:hypothetical protein
MTDPLLLGVAAILSTAILLAFDASAGLDAIGVAAFNSETS